ncbi:MAG: hypothetical protein P4N60_11135 [Verrucomicrobiae bacterium]|nr:hypothetical protein [Verrucomicrobiae bacterium]
MSAKISATAVAVPEDRHAIFTQMGASAARLVAMDNLQDNDAKLHELTVGIGQVAKVVTLPRARTGNLVRVAAFCMGWLECMGESDPLARIHVERLHQEQLLRDGELLFRCSDAVINPKRKLRVLVEELGEVAEAIDALEDIQAESRRQALKSELVQVAAVAVAWLETPTSEGKV